MPVWYEKAKPHIESGALVVLGVIQEQHPERCRLFAQWKQLDFPILLDQANVLGLTGVPIPVAIDEHGLVHRGIKRPEDLADFVATRFAAPENVTSVPALTPNPNSAVQQPAVASRELASDAAREHGDAIMIFDAGNPSAAIRAYRRALAHRSKSDGADTFFRLGVAYLSRFESESIDRNSKDFGRAIACWKQALALNPNQYIWRRRIQQYGPRLDKPYPFYDWILQAKQDIIARGGTPVALRVPLAGAEIAQPERSIKSQSLDEDPDPDAKIRRDDERRVVVAGTMVPHTNPEVTVARGHIDLTPNSDTEWTLDSGPLVVWVEPVDGCEFSVNRIESLTAVSKAATRRVEFEIHAAKGQMAKVINGYALYFICHKPDGKCLYLRQDFSVRGVEDLSLAAGELQEDEN